MQQNKQLTKAFCNGCKKKVPIPHDCKVTGEQLRLIHPLIYGGI